MEEELLSGGNMTAVQKSGDTVLRQQTPFSPTVHRLLLHLRRAGFDRAPAFLGVDGCGREVLSFVEGRCPENWPLAGGEAHLAQVAGVAKLLRSYHDATAAFERRPSDRWMLRAPGPEEVICHNDVAPYNLTFAEGKPFGLIDFDTCCPGPRVWDIAYALYRFAPLSEEVYDPETGKTRRFRPQTDGEFRRRCVGAFLSAYGLKKPEDLGGWVCRRLGYLADFIDEQAGAGHPAFVRMQREGHADFYRRETAFIRQNKESWF